MSSRSVAWEWERRTVVEPFVASVYVEKHGHLQRRGRHFAVDEEIDVAYDETDPRNVLCQTRGAGAVQGTFSMTRELLVAVSVPLELPNIPLGRRRLVVAVELGGLKIAAGEIVEVLEVQERGAAARVAPVYGAQPQGDRGLVDTIRALWVPTDTLAHVSEHLHMLRPLVGAVRLGLDQGGGDRGTD